MCLNPKMPQMPRAPRPEDTFSADNRERQRRAGMQGFASTILTGPKGDLTPANTQQKSILGG